MDSALPVIWFVAIAALWIGYLLLEGFDLGVGMHLLVSARGKEQRRLMLNTIGPVWDGNEVWLIVAGAATFAAFPFWYAALFSSLYVPLVIVLLALILRAVAIEYRSKLPGSRWTSCFGSSTNACTFSPKKPAKSSVFISSNTGPFPALRSVLGSPKRPWNTISPNPCTSSARI